MTTAFDASAPPAHRYGWRAHTGSAVGRHDVGECSVLWGGADSVADAVAALRTPTPRALIVHALEPRSSVLWRSLMAIDAGAFSAIAHSPGAPRVVAMLTPVTRRVTAPPIVHLAPSQIVRASRVLLSSLVNPPPGANAPDAHLDRLLIAVSCEILRACTSTGELCTEDTSIEARLRTLLHERHTDPELDVAQIARELHVSRRQLYRHTQEGEGIAALIANLRYDTARSLLETRHDLTIGEVAQLAGFSTSARLRAQFLARHGVTPSEHRRRSSTSSSSPSHPSPAFVGIVPRPERLVPPPG